MSQDINKKAVLGAFDPAGPGYSKPSSTSETTTAGRLAIPTTMGGYAWAEVITKDTTKISAAHMNELRANVDDIDTRVDNHIRKGNDQHPRATYAENGFMYAEDYAAIYNHISSRGGNGHLDATAQEAGYQSAADKAFYDAHVAGHFENGSKLIRDIDVPVSTRDASSKLYTDTGDAGSVSHTNTVVEALWEATQGIVHDLDLKTLAAAALLLGKDDVKIQKVMVINGDTVPLPDGFTQEECIWGIMSPVQGSLAVTRPLDGPNEWYINQQTRVLTCRRIDQLQMNGDVLVLDSYGVTEGGAMYCWVLGVK